MEWINKQEYQQHMNTLTNTTKKTQDALFNDLNSYQQNVLLTQIKMNDNLKKSVIQLFQKALTENRDNKDYTNSINQLFNTQNLLFMGMHNDCNDYLTQQEENTNILHNQSHIKWFNTFCVNNNNNVIEHNKTIIKLEPYSNGHNTNNAIQETQINNNVSSIAETEKIIITKIENDTMDNERIKTDRPFICNECNKSFMQKYHLKNHINQVHTNNGKYGCQYCPKRFGTPSALTKHIRCHTNEKPYKCNECDKSFASRGNLKTHIVVHSGEKPYACNFCGKKFTQSSNRNTHQTKHCKNRHIETS